MGNTHQTGVKKDDHGGSRNQQPQAVSAVLDQFQAGVKGDDHGGSRNQQPQVVSVVVDQFQAGAAERAPNQLQPLGGDFEATSMLKNCKKNSATDGGGSSSRTDILRPAAESIILRHDDPHHSSPPSLPEPEDEEFVLNTLPVETRCVGDGDGFIAYVKKTAGVAVSGNKMAGDTNNREQYRIRMRGIDAPELKMKYGVESRNELVKLIGGKRVAIHVYGKDQYGRYLGDIYCDDVFIQEQMLKRGFAWHFKIYDKRPELAQWEREARAERLGLWSLDNPQKPWEWRWDQRNNKKENADDIQVELHDKLEELKKKNKKAKDRAKESEKAMESAVADNMKLNDQIQELNKRAANFARKSNNKLQSVLAVNMDLNDKLQELKKKNKKAEDQAKKSKKEMESVVADNMKLNDQIQELNKKAANFARNSKKKLQSVLAVNMDLNDKLQELQKKNKMAEDRAMESDKEMENVVVENMERKLYKAKKNKKSEQAVQTPSAPPAKDSAEKETIVWRKKTSATTP